MALHPPLIRYVKGYPYHVQPGDHVTQICGRFGMPASKWPELVGANLHKPTCGCGGTLYKCFSRLEPGELLRVPAHWREPGGQARLGLGIPMPTLPNIDMMNAFATMVQAYLATHPTAWPLPSLPAPATVTPIAQVLYTWFPYLRNLPAVTNKSAFPADQIKLMEAIVTKGILTEQNFALLIVSANTFLKAIGINEGQPVPAWVKAIPWADIAWAKIAEAFLSIPPNVWAKLDAIFAKKDPGSVTPQIEQPYTTPPDLPELPNFFSASTWAPGTPTGKMIRSQQFASTKWSSEFTQAVLAHKDFVACSAKRAATMSNAYAKLVGCPECYQTPDEFVALLCSASADPCSVCKSTSKEEVPEGCWNAPSRAGGCLNPTLIGLSSGSPCDFKQAYSECAKVAQRHIENVRAGNGATCRPGQSEADCEAEMFNYCVQQAISRFKCGGGAEPPGPPLPPVDPGKEDPTKPPVEPVVAGEKSDNTFTYAAAAVGVVLVGGLIVMMSGDK